MKRPEIIIATVHSAIMIPFVAFIAVQVYQINARTTANQAIMSSNAERIGVNEKNIFNHIINHGGSGKTLNLGMPLISLTDRRKKLRVEVTK